MRKLFLHVGVHRTGTTSTQRFMKANFDALRKKGWLYPYGEERHDALITRIRNGKVSVNEVAQDLIRRADSHKDPIHSIVLSDEDISLIEDFSIFAPLAEVFDVKIVVSLRRQDLWLESWYSQNIKWQWNPALAHLTFAEFFPKRKDFFWIDYADRFAHFESIFGPDCVIAGVFERGDMPEGPIQSFLRMIGIEDMSNFGPFIHHNSSLSPQMSEYMRMLPMDAMDFKARARVEEACIAVDKRLNLKGSRLLMSHPERLIVMAEHEAGNSAVARKYLKREILFNDPLPDPSEPLADVRLPADLAAINAQFTGPIMVTLANTLMEARANLREMAAMQQKPKGKPAGKPPAQPVAVPKEPARK